MPQHPDVCNTVGHVTPECPVQLTTYGYYPNLSVNSFFAALFGLLCVLQLLFGSLRRTWTYLIALVIGTFGEAVGYGGRIIMHHNPWSSNGFKIQVSLMLLLTLSLPPCCVVVVKTAFGRLLPCMTVEASLKSYPQIVDSESGLD